MARRKIRQTHSGVILGAILIALNLFLTSCIPTPSTTAKGRGATSSGFVNTAEGLSPGQGRVFAANPYIATGNYSLPPDYDMNLVIQAQEKVVDISDTQFLEKDCTINFDSFNYIFSTYSVVSQTPYTVTDCYKNFSDELSTPLINTSTKWAYDANSDEFLEVNMFGHVKLILEQWMGDLKFLYQNMAYDLTTSFIPSTFTAYDTAIPQDIFMNSGYWFSSNQTLVSYSKCDFPNNAFYAPATNSICMGQDTFYPTVFFSQDPSITYHEVGHAVNKLMLNYRNLSAGTVLNSSLGVTFYDEAGGFNEALADYLSYYMNLRPHWGEWALGERENLIGASRPLTEDDPLHAPGISSDASQRLSYPEYIMYEPNTPSILYEDVHNIGMIFSHYLYALTKDLEDTCTWSEEYSTQFVMTMIMEALAELGDLTAKGSDNFAAGHLNLDADNAYEWIHISRPNDYRKFAQAIARKLYMTISDGQALQARNYNPISCGNLVVYPKAKIEQLLDMYGLLLFDTYNLDGNSIDDGHDGTHTGSLPESNPIIDPLNRVKSVLIPKDKLIFDPEAGAPEAYVIDKRSSMLQTLQDLTAFGLVQVSDKIDSTLAYNNGNGKISPGEFVGIVLNTYNNSNSTMGGVQIIGNDWDHVKNQTQIISGQSVTRGFPCNNLGDNFPATIAEGAADLSTGEGTQGGCDWTTRYNGKNSSMEPNEELAPVCLVQINTDSGTQWVQQDQYLEELDGLDSSDCLGDSTKDCFLRVAPGVGGGQSWVGQIPPKSNWAANLIDESTGDIQFKLNHLIYLEVSPWINPGTTFLCRFRARFTNCSDCNHDVNHQPSGSFSLYDDYQDYEYSGAKPYKILNFKFTVID